MTRVVLLDAGPLGMVTNPRATPRNDAAKRWLRQLMASETAIVLPEIADYEVRRELLRVGSRRGLERLDALAESIQFVPITSTVMRTAAGMWAYARQHGVPTAPDAALDCDVILAAQALFVAQAGHEVVVATTNVRHLARFVDARAWEDVR